MKPGICTDHSGFTLKEMVHPFLIQMNYEVVDCRAFRQENKDNHVDPVRGVAAKDVSDD